LRAGFVESRSPCTDARQCIRWSGVLILFLSGKFHGSSGCNVLGISEIFSWHRTCSLWGFKDREIFHGSGGNFDNLSSFMQLSRFQAILATWVKRQMHIIGDQSGGE
jgi:hypothetical protein